METLEQAKRNVADLHWLATLLTGRPEIATELTFQAIAPAEDANAFFSTWILAWSRRIVIAKALAVVREDLARSARQMEVRRADKLNLPPRSWTLEPGTTTTNLERALLRIDIFPRAAVLLLVFERVPLHDAAILLESDPNLVREGLTAGLRELTTNFARMPWKSGVTASNTNHEEHYVRPTPIPS